MADRAVEVRWFDTEWEAVANGVEHALELPCVARADWAMIACDTLAPCLGGGAVAVAIAGVGASGELLKIESFGARGVGVDWALRLFHGRRLPEADGSGVMIWEDDSDSQPAADSGQLWAQARLGTQSHRLVVWGSSSLARFAMVMGLIVERLAARAERAFGDGFTSCLTACEIRVLAALVEGKTVKEIATTMHRSPHTVHDHVKCLHRKLGASTRGELVSKALGCSLGTWCLVGERG